MKAIAVFCIFALFAITFVQCEKTSFKNLTHNKTGLPHFAHHNRTIQVPHFPKFNKTHGIKPAFPHFNKTNVLRKALKADEVEEDEFFFRTNKTHQNKTHGAKPFPKFNVTRPTFPKFNITKPKFNISKPVFPKFNKTNVLRHTLKADEAEDEELFSFFNRNKTTNKTHKATNKTVLRHALKADEAEDDEFFFRTNKTQNKTHGAKPFPKFNVTRPTFPKFNVTRPTFPKFNVTKPVFPKFNKTNVLRHTLKADEAEDEELFSFFNRNKTTNKTHKANSTNIFRRALKADDVEEDEFFFRRNRTHQNKTHNHANKTHHNKTHGIKPSFLKLNKTKPAFPKFNISKPAFPKFNKTNVLRHALKADEAEDEELFSFINRNKTHTNKTHGAKPFPKFNVTRPTFPKFNITKPKFNISKPVFPKFNNTLRHALKADEAEDEELFSFINRNKTHTNKTHKATNKTHGAKPFPKFNITKPVFPKFNVTKPKFNISKPAFPKFNSTLRHALKADEAEDDEFFFRRNATRVVPRPHNKTHQANHTVGIARHNLTHPIVNKNHTKGFLKF